VLWLHIARLRAGAPDGPAFAAGMKTLDLSRWPAPIFDLFLGRTSLETMRRAAFESAAGNREGMCQGAVFGDEYALTHGDRVTAAQLLHEATNMCLATENQYLTAWAELKRLEPAMRNAGLW